MLEAKSLGTTENHIQKLIMLHYFPAKLHFIFLNMFKLPFTFFIRYYIVVANFNQYRNVKKKLMLLPTHPQITYLQDNQFILLSHHITSVEILVPEPTTITGIPFSEGVGTLQQPWPLKHCLSRPLLDNALVATG